MAWNGSSTKILFVFRAKFSALWDLTKLNDDSEPSLQVLAEHGFSQGIQAARDDVVNL